MRLRVSSLALAWTAAALLAPPARSAAAGDGLELVQLVKEDKDQQPHVLSRAGGFFHVYVLGPLLGGAIASQLFVHILEPQAKRRVQGAAQ